MGKIFTILGQTCSGKTSLAKEVSKSLGIKQITTYTTRPARKGEIDGVDYHFISNDDFACGSFICQNSFEVKPYGLCHYGVNMEDLDTEDDVLLIVTPSGLDELKNIYGERVFSIYIIASPLDRFNRYIQREFNNPNVREEAARRLQADAQDFTSLEYNVDEIIINKSYNKALCKLDDIIAIEMMFSNE
jgi:guanylate kinase